MLPIIDCAVLVVINPAGPVHSVIIVTGIFTTGLSSTVQVIVITDPTGLIIPVYGGDKVTEVGAGTTNKKINSYYKVTLNAH